MIFIILTADEFYDELFDSSFDEKGIELIAEILKRAY
jgi:hypothetical protein